MVGRRFGAVGKAAAAALLMAGAFGASRLTGGPGPTPVAQPAAAASTVLSGVLLATDGRPLGGAYVYKGSPSWLFMDLHGSGLTGRYTCVLHLGDGSTVLAGVVPVYHGAGDWAGTVRVPVSQLKTATLLTTAGVTVASATFS
jgi:hypothetical protein